MKQINTVLIEQKNNDIFIPFIPEYFGGLKEEDIVIGAFEEGETTPCGALVAKNLGYEIDITWVNVLPSARRQGVGTRLVEALVDYNLTEKYMLPVFIRYKADPEETMGYEEFLLSLEMFDISIDSYHVKVDKESRLSSKQYKDMIEKKMPQNGKTVIKSFSKLDIKAKKKVILDLSEMCFGIDNMEEWTARFLPDLSKVCMLEDELKAVILIEKGENEEELKISFLDIKDPVYGYGIMWECAKDIQSQYADCAITMDVINETSGKLLEHIFPENYTEYINMVAEWDFRLPDNYAERFGVEE